MDHLAVLYAWRRIPTRSGCHLILAPPPRAFQATALPQRLFICTVLIMYQFRIRAPHHAGSILESKPIHVSIRGRSSATLNALWGGTIEAALARSIHKAKSVRLDIEAYRNGGSGEWFALADWQYIQGCLFPLEPYPVVFVVTENGVPKLIAKPR